MRHAVTLSRNNRVCENGVFTGYSFERGSFYGTCDDRADRWYIDHADDSLRDRRGPGHRTRADALECIARSIGEYRELHKEACSDDVSF